MNTAWWKRAARRVGTREVNKSAKAATILSLVLFATTCTEQEAIHALFVVNRYHAKFRNHDFTCPDTSDTAFAMALGGGLDIQATRHVDIRAIQVDYLPVFRNGHREDGLRFSAGVKIK